MDCLDRTNTAQFVVGNCALGLQFFSLGFTPDPEEAVKLNTDCTRILEAMYEDHGDTLALQYGGSQLIHTINSYRKASPWTSKANDIAQTMRRYYSNALSDAEKQNAMNVFLGKFRPESGKPPIWAKNFSDVYLHMPMKRGFPKYFPQWFSPELRTCLPFPLLERKKVSLLMVKYSNPGQGVAELYEDYYKPQEFNVMNETFQFKEVGHSVRDYMPNCCTDYSPFVIREREIRKREEETKSSQNLLRKFKDLVMPTKTTATPVPAITSDGHTVSIGSSLRDENASSESGDDDTTTLEAEGGNGSASDFEMIVEEAVDAIDYEPTVHSLFLEQSEVAFEPISPSDSQLYDRECLKMATAECIEDSKSKPNPLIMIDEDAYKASLGETKEAKGETLSDFNAGCIKIDLTPSEKDKEIFDSYSGYYDGRSFGALNRHKISEEDQKLYDNYVIEDHKLKGLIA